MASFKTSFRLCWPLPYCPLPKFTLAFLLVVIAVASPLIAQDRERAPGEVGGIELGPIATAEERQAGQQGGITEGDFQPLIDLIQSVIGSDTWEDAGGEGTVIAYPAGVHVDTSGIRERLETIDAQRHARQTPLSAKSSALRKISLKRLLGEVHQTTTFGRPLDPSVKNMAGVYEIKHVMVDPAENDIILAGPAGPWETDSSGNTVNRKTGEPVLQLDDFLVCLKNASLSRPERGKFGCTIVPRQKSLAAAANFLKTTRLSGKRWADQLRDVVGRQDVEVNGIAPDSHAATVLVEADLLMKMIGMGTEPSIAAVPDYFNRITGKDQTGQRDSLVRWWFTVDVSAISMDAERNFFEISGPTVKVMSENEHLNALGQRVHLGQSGAATEGFARDFTDHFEEMSRKYPVFAKLRNVFELALVAGIIGEFELSQRVGLNQVLDGHFQASTKAGANGSLDTYWPAALPFSSDVESIVNYRRVSFSKGGKRYRQQLVAVSGGVEFDFSKTIANKTRDVQSQSAFPSTNAAARTQEAWWWD